ncbi:DUF6318 family protein [Terrabacter sp. Root181]|uniref:DUF6318 family protein n=1 Tax=Terrabacter sp. Root181 TaxID=1736484 RepID=UPI00350F2548
MTAAARSHRHRTLLAFAATSVALATLGACTGSDPGPAVTTPPSTSAVTSSATPTTTTSTAPSPTASVDPVIAKIPAAALARTAPGAQAFARHFIESLNDGATKPDATVLAGLFAPTCETCRAMSESLESLEAKGQRHTGPSIRVLRTSPLAFSTSSARVLVDVEQTSVNVVNQAGDKVRTTANGPGTFVMSLSFDNGHWTATKLQTAS